MQTISIPYTIHNTQDQKQIILCIKAQNYAKKLAYNTIHNQLKTNKSIDINTISQNIHKHIIDKHNTYKHYITASICLHATIDMYSMYKKRKILFEKTQEKHHIKQEKIRFDKAVFHAQMKAKRTNTVFDMKTFKSEFIKKPFVLDISKMKRIVFGTKTLAIRRSNKLINKTDYRQQRDHAFYSIGESNPSGNRIFKLDNEGTICKFKVPNTPKGHYIELQLGKLNGKWNQLLKDLSIVAKQNEIPITFTLSPTKLNITFNPMDLRKLQPHETLTAAKDADGSKKKGRKRSNNYVVPQNRIDLYKPIHPEWKDRIHHINNRVIGIDLNPNWIGCAIVQTNISNFNDLRNVQILSHKLFKLDIPRYYAVNKQPHKYVNKINSLGRSINPPYRFPSAVMHQTLSEIAKHIIQYARAYNVGIISLENGLGNLQSKTKNKSLNYTINNWGRSVFKDILRRKAELAGIRIVEVFAGYSSVIGNITYNLPDACASAVEIGRRGIVLTSDSISKREMIPDIWMNESVLQLIQNILAKENKTLEVDIFGNMILTDSNGIQMNIAYLDKYICGWVHLNKELKRLRIRYRRPQCEKSRFINHHSVIGGYAVTEVCFRYGLKYTDVG